MYNETATQVLADRIGWAGPVPPSSFVLAAAAHKADSGRYFNGFHKLATVENVMAAIPNPAADSDTINAYLMDMKRAGVLKVLGAVIDRNDRANWLTDYNGRRTDISGTDYSIMITTRAAVLDEAIGYQVAIDAIELMVSSPRSNQEQRSAQDTYVIMKMELEGEYNESGKMVAKGLYAKLKAALAGCIGVLFPEVNIAKNTIRAIRLW